MKTIVSALIALSVLAGIARPRRAPSTPRASTSSSIAPAPTEPNRESSKKMRRVVIAKALILTVLGLYLVMGIGGALRTGADPAHPMATAHQERLR